MILFWRVRYLDYQEKNFKDRDLWLDTAILDSVTKAAVGGGAGRKPASTNGPRRCGSDEELGLSHPRMRPYQYTRAVRTLRLFALETLS
jgi:hypothetical protein